MALQKTCFYRFTYATFLQDPFEVGVEVSSEHPFTGGLGLLTLYLMCGQVRKACAQGHLYDAVAGRAVRRHQRTKGHGWGIHGRHEIIHVLCS